MQDDQTIYEQIGKHEGITALVNKFYFYMDTLPEVSEIRQMHPPTLDSSIEKLILFLSGWTNGPQLYIEKFGHPRLRARHLPFKIGIKERDQWLYCMYKAIDDQTSISKDLNIELKKSFAHIADFMRNQQE
jgi:hemoglobin